jgi:hypothetical protein
MTAQMAKALRRQNPAAAKRLRRQPKAIVSKTHGVIQVQTADGPLDLWAAPATDGGTCCFVGWQSDLHKTQAAGNSSCAPATASLSNKGSSAHSLDLSTWGDYQHRNYNIIQGYALRRRHDRPRGALKRQHPDAARSRRPIPRRVETERALATTSKDRLGDLAQRARPPRWLLEATTPIDRLYERTSEQSRSAEDVGALTSALPDSDLIGQPIDSLAVTKPLPYRLVSLATFAVAAAWLACACYALADLVSH